MDVVFLDTNALLKLYHSERGSAWLKSYTSNRQIVISELALYEVISIMRRFYAEGSYSKNQALKLLAQIEQDKPNFQIVLISGKRQRNKMRDLVFNIAVGLRIRALDAIQLLSAQIALDAVNSLNVQPAFTFVSADAQLLRVAQSLGLTVENPENHP
jgi:predicted nucleic acid-binding protein